MEKIKNSNRIKNIRSRILHKLFAITLENIMGTITHVSTLNPVAALTFDDGPHPEYTPHLLDILKRHDARATFFMIGKAAERFPELVRQVAQTGHAIGIHSWDHPSFPSINGKDRRKQIRACAKAVAPYGLKLFRPPYGHQSMASRIDALLLGYKVIAWNTHAFDWENHSAEWMVDKLMSRLIPGSIILLHDTLWDIIVEGAEDRLPMLEALNMFLEKVGNRFHFITIPELLKLGRVQRRNWYVRNHNDW